MSHRDLIVLAFDKARTEEEEKGNIKPSKSAIGLRLAMQVAQLAGFSFGEKSLINYYNKAVKEDSECLKIPQIEVANALLNYLGFKSYPDFIKQISRKNSVAQVKRIRLLHLLLKFGTYRIETEWFFKLTL